MAPGKIPEGEHPHQQIPTQYGKPADAPVAHKLCRLTDVRILVHRDDGAGHDIPHAAGFRQLLRRHAPGDDIPVGENAAQPSLRRHHRQRADVVTVEQKCRRGGGILRGNGHDVAVHQFFDLHLFDLRITVCEVIMP